MCSIYERHMKKMKRWSQIYEWSKRVRTYLEEDFSSSSLDEEILSFAVLRNDCLIRIICGGKDWNKGVSMRRRLLGNYDGEIHVGL